jgi:hypothetical protein
MNHQGKGFSWIILLLIPLILLVLFYLLKSPSPPAGKKENPPLPLKTPPKQMAVPPTPLARPTPSSPPQVNASPIMRHQRELIGKERLRYQDSQEQLPMVNQINDQWPQFLLESLQRHAHPQITFKVTPIKSYIQLEGEKGRFVEKVRIESSRVDHSSNSFLATVDSETGHIIETWHRTIPFPSHHSSSGYLPNSSH